MTSQAAIQFRGKLYISEYHVDCLSDCIEDPVHPESHAEVEAIIDGDQEPVTWGRVYPVKGFVPFRFEEQKLRQEWYVGAEPVAKMLRFG